MKTTKSKRKRSKIAVFVLLPALIFIAMVGWCLYCLGDRKKPNKTEQKPAEKDNVTIMPIIYEEKQEIINTQ